MHTIKESIVESIYLETTVVSYYTSKLSRDIIVLAHQEITREWWPMATIRRFNVFISEIVIEEAGMGDEEAAERRLEELKTFPHLELTDMVEKMAQVYMQELEIPEKSFRDAAHLAVASVHDIDYLVTWNCAHLANGEIIRRLMRTNKTFGIQTPIICTPEGLMEV